MNSTTSLLLPAAGALGAYAVYRALSVYLRRSPLADLPGPPDKSWLLGHFHDIVEDHDELRSDKWMGEYGHVLTYKDLFGTATLFTDDLRAIHHVLSHSEAFTKSDFVRRMLSNALGKGVLVAEGATHRAQRRVLSPAFGPPQVRELSGIFLDKSNELRDLWLSQIDPVTGQARLNAVSGLSAATLDIIGLAGFGYAFDALARPVDNPNELSAAFATMMAARRDALSILLMNTVPGAQWIPTAANRGRAEARAIMDRIGRELVRERKAAAIASGKADSGGRDLLSLLVRANMSENPAQRLSDDEVLAQIPTFILAGHETTSTAVSWTLFELAQHPEVQAELRAELRGCPLPLDARGNEPLDADTIAALDKLPLLDAVVRETLRVDAPVANAGRIATADTDVPLARPFIDRHGVRRDSVRVAKGDQIAIPILAVHRSEALWGADAREWKPERWLAGVPEGARDVQGLWGHLLTFLAGSHACIGYRFSLLETKILLHALVADLAFELAVPAAEIGKKKGVVTRPVLANARDKGIQLPLIITRAEED